MEKNIINDVIRFFNNRNCLIRAEICGINSTIFYNRGRQNTISYTAENHKYITYNSIVNIPEEIEYKGKIVFKGVLIKTDNEGVYKFVVYDISYIEDKFEWGDDVDEETYITTSKSTVYNKINLAWHLGFDVVPLTVHTMDINRTPTAVKEALKMIKESCDMLQYPFWQYVVLYNDTLYADRLKSNNIPIKMEFSK
jgi:hypothetical protein